LETSPFAPTVCSWGLTPPLEVGVGDWVLLLAFLLLITPPFEGVGGAASSPPLKVGGDDGGGFWGLQRKVVQLLVWLLYLDVAFGCWFGGCVRSSRYLCGKDAVLFGDRADEGRLLGVVDFVRWIGYTVVDVVFVNYTTLGSWGWCSIITLGIWGW